jgi:hypothetical protein
MAPLGSGCVSRPDGGSDSGRVSPELLFRQAADRTTGLGEVQVDIRTQCLEWRHVDHASLVGKRPLKAFSEELVQRVEKGGEGLSGTSGCCDQGVAPRTDGVPTEPLRSGRLTESILEPAGDNWMKGGEQHRLNIALYWCAEALR